MYQIGQVEEITGLTKRQISYWDNTGLVKASVNSNGQKRNRLWGFSDLIALRTVKRLREQNISIQKIRVLLEYVAKTWPDIENHLSQLTFYVLGNGREVLVLGPNEQFPVSAFRAQGQSVLIIPGKDMEKEVKEGIHRLADSPLSLIEIEESSKAWADYIEGRDSGETLDEIGRDLAKGKRRA